MKLKRKFKILKIYKSKIFDNKHLKEKSIINYMNNSNFKSVKYIYKLP